MKRTKFGKKRTYVYCCALLEKFTERGKEVHTNAGFYKMAKSDERSKRG